MSYVSSTTELQAVLQAQKGQAEYKSTGTADTSGASFSEVLNQSYERLTEDMDAIFEEAASRFQLSSQLLKAVAKAESNFNTSAISRAGAMGVMQLMPGTAQSLGVANPFDARQSIMGGAEYLKTNLDKFGSLELALAAYNAGPGSVEKYGGIPPYSETQNYIAKVMSYLSGEDLSANQSVQTGGSPVSGYDSEIVDLCKYITSMGGYSSISSYAALSDYSGLGSYASLPGTEDTVTMDLATYTNLIQLLRIQMLMSADEEMTLL